MEVNKMIPFPDKKYNIIYADPPWSFKNYSDKWHEKNASSKWVGKKYKCMDKLSIGELPINEIADKDCILFLWVTMPSMVEGLELIEKWGFKYKTVAFTWVKQNKVSNIQNPITSLTSILLVIEDKYTTLNILNSRVF